VDRGAILKGHVNALWLARSTHRELDDCMSELAQWDSFYVIVGPAAEALIGLQLVVVYAHSRKTTTACRRSRRRVRDADRRSFRGALLLSALQRVPWQAITPAAALWGPIGLSGVAYALIVTRRMRAQTVYHPEFEDWLFYAVLPLAAYATLALSAFAAPLHTRQALFGVGTAALLLLFVGVHNTWDSVAYRVLGNKPQ